MKRSLPIAPALDPPAQRGDSRFHENPTSITQSNAAPWALQPNTTPAGPTRIDALYIHIPFCFHKCHYCDFYSIVDEPGSSDRQAIFTRRLIDELRLRAAQLPLRPRTLFIGGGTPTLLPPQLWRLLLDELRSLGISPGLAEFTVEANPETVTPELLATLAQGGVNRLSIGAQSFNPALLKALERWHDPANVPRAVARAKDAGIANINADLIFAIPGQSLADLDADLDAALALGTTHLSYYGLTYEPNTAMTQRLNMGKVTPVEESLEAAMYERVMDRLADAGFEHYEISAWSRPDRRCAHNLVYWTNGNWLGVGPGGASHLDGTRWKNRPHLGQYLDSRGEPPTMDHETLDPARRTGEEIMLGLRLRDGIARAWLESHLPANDPRQRRIAELVAMSLLEWRDDRLRLTRRGLAVGDSVIAELL